MQIIASAESGKTEVVRPPAVPAPAEQGPAPAGSGALTFGQTHVHDNGVEITVTVPTAYTPGKWAARGEGAAHYAKVTVTIKNGLAQQFDPTMAHPTASSGGREGDQIYDGKVAQLGRGVRGAEHSTTLTIEGPPGFAYDHTAWSN